MPYNDLASSLRQPAYIFMRVLIAILVLLSAAQAQKVHFNPVDRQVLLQREDNAPAGIAERQARMITLFHQAGCTSGALIEQKLAAGNASNVICTLRGESVESIVIGASYSQAAPDNWSSAAMLPSLYQALAGKKRHHTLVFVAFADEKRGLEGSGFFVTHLSADSLSHTEAMVNLDSLGLSFTKVSVGRSDKKLVKSFFTMVYAMKLPASQVDLDRGVSIDSEPFEARNIPEITIHSFTVDDVSLLQNHGAPADTAFHPEFYFDSYHLISAYIAYLDKTLKSRPHPK